MSARQTLLDSLLTRLQAIRVTDGYQTDAGEAVYAGKTPLLGKDDPPAAIAILVGDDQVSDQSGFGGEEGLTLTVLPFELQAVAKADLDQPLVTVEQVLADIRRAVETDDRSFGGLLTTAMTRGRTRTLRREAGSVIVGTGVEYRCTFVESWGG